MSSPTGSRSCATALVEVGTRDQIMRRPQQAYTKRLLAAVPVPDPDIQRERRDKRLADLAAGVDADETPGAAAAPDRAARRAEDAAASGL
jgi:ABC-type glutathione transport system ATPase component